jgi:hypothetical protein
MSRFRRVWAVRIALAAMLFSALSPAMASVLFADRPHVLARLLALPVVSAGNALPGEICHTPDAVSASSASPVTTQDSEHAAHGVLCSFCLPASASVALPSLPAALAINLDVPSAVIPAPLAPRGPAVFLSTHLARGPPTDLN